ncbi:MAG: PKD domain-containing protein [bacterium]|nr:PKD domain-containing protein [bacterium]
MWAFGDGTTSTLSNPTHTYTTTGVYTVSLTVNGPGGADTFTRSDYIVNEPPPIAAFIATPTSGQSPLTVSFTDQSIGMIDSWLWSFGDESITSNATKSVTCLYVKGRTQ